MQRWSSNGRSAVKLQSNGRRTAAESKSNRSCYHRRLSQAGGFLFCRRACVRPPRMRVTVWLSRKTLVSRCQPLHPWHSGSGGLRPPTPPRSGYPSVACVQSTAHSDTHYQLLLRVPGRRDVLVTSFHFSSVTSWSQAASLHVYHWKKYIQRKASGRNIVSSVLCKIHS